MRRLEFAQLEQTLKLSRRESQELCHITHSLHFHFQYFPVSADDVDEEIHELQTTL